MQHLNVAILAYASICVLLYFSFYNINNFIISIFR